MRWSQRRLALALPLSRRFSPAWLNYMVVGPHSHEVARSHSHERRRDDHCFVGGFWLANVVRYLALAPVEVSLEAVGESKRI